MTNTPCRSEEVAISRLLSGDLPADEKTRIEKHLEECPACREYYSRLRDDDRLLSSFAKEAGEHIPGLEQRILSALPEVPVGKDSGRGWNWRSLFRVRYAGVTAAAAALLLLFFHLQKPPLTMAQVIEAFNQQKWVHIKYDDGIESWVCLEDGRRFYKKGGYVEFLDRGANTMQQYRPGLGEDYIVAYRYAEPTPWERKTAWEAVMKTTFEATEKRRKSQHDEAHEEETDRKVLFRMDKEEVDGKELVRMDEIWKDALGRRIVRYQIWADPETRLPVRKRERLFADDRRKEGREYREGVFDFPQSGPSSIYDLGVPRDMKIIRIDRTPEGDEGTGKIVEAGRRACLAFPEHFRAVTWRSDTPQTVDVIYWSGSPGSYWVMGEPSQVKKRDTYYWNVSGEPERYLPLPTTVDGVLDWAATQPPVSIWLSDGEREYSANGLPGSRPDPGEKPTVTVRQEQTPATLRFHDYQWPYTGFGDDIGLVFLEDAPDLPEGCIALRSPRATQRIDYYIDPARDHICVRRTVWNLFEGEFHRAWDDELSDFVQLPGGQWYARKRTQTNHSTPPKNLRRSTSEYITDIQILEPDEFPPNIFSADEFFDGTYKVESPW